MGHSREIQIDLCTTHIIQKKTYESGCSRHWYKRIYVCVFVYVGAFVTRCVCVCECERNAVYVSRFALYMYIRMHASVCVRSVVKCTTEVDLNSDSF